MSDITDTSSTDEDLFRFQFNTAEPFKKSQSRDGSLDAVDFDVRGLEQKRTRSITLRGMPAILNRIIMYFASQRGDYIRSTRGNEFAFIYNAPANTATQFRIVSTATAIMRREFSNVRVRDIKVSRISKNKRTGWNIRLVVRHSSFDGDAGIDIPMGEGNLPSGAEFIRV